MVDETCRISIASEIINDEESVDENAECETFGKYKDIIVEKLPNHPTPERNIKHHIPLQSGSKPINLRHF